MRIKSVKIPSLIYRVTLLVAFVLLTSVRVYGQFVSNAVMGNYEDASSWNGTQPPVAGNPGQALTIITGSTITRNGNFNPVNVTVNGTFNITGDYSNNQWSGVIINSGGKLEIFGNLVGSAGVTVENGGLLIVHGNFTSSGSGVTVRGNIIVKGNYSTSSNTTLDSGGNLVVGGNFTHAGGGISGISNNNLYLINPDAVISHPGWGDIANGNYGDIEDFIENEANNTELLDLVGEVIPELYSSSEGLKVVYTSSGTFPVPNDVTTIMVEVWGGGGRGSTRTSNGAGAGGGGGAYSRSILSVVPGQSYTVTVGAGSTNEAAGGDSWFGSTSTILAKGGNSAGNNSNSSATGGSASSGVGDVRYNGGNGAIGPNSGSNRGGGGGSSGGTGSNGNYTDNSTNNTTGGSINGGGSGGNGRNQNSSGNGTNGSAPGGGGGGAYRSGGTSTRTGGAGADGQVIVWTPTVYYSQNSGNPNTLTNWRTSSGVAPTSFTADLQTFVIRNGHNMTTSAAWTVSGAKTKVHIQNGGTLTENNNITLSSNTTLQIDNGGTLKHNVNSITIFGGTVILAATSTVNYGFAGAQNVVVFSYGNLTISGSGTKTMQGNITGTGLTVSGPGSIHLGNNLTHTFSGPFVLSGGSITGGSSTLRLGGTVTVSGGSFNAGTGTVEFYGAAQNIPGTTYHNLTISGGNTKTVVNNHIRVNGNLTLNDGILSLGNFDLTLGPGSGTIGSFSADRMINAGNRTITKEGNSATDFILTLPIGTGTVYTPVQINSLSAASVSSSAEFKVQTFDIPASGVPGENSLKRHWITSTSGISGPLLVDISFTYASTDLSYGGNAVAYEIIYRPSSGSWEMPGGASAAGSNPLRASAASSLDATWTGTGLEYRSFYSFASGSWDNPETWTIDPSGTQWLNPGAYTPSTSPSSVNDDVTILSGRTITVSSNEKINKTITVTGTLDLGNTTGHSFTSLSGTGRIRLAGDNFPSGDATDFISGGEGESVVEYYGNTYNISIPRTFSNVEVNMTGSNELFLMADYMINGKLIISGGVLRFGNNSSTNPVNVTVHGDMTVEETGKLSTGTANTRHQLNLYGDFINNGEARFTNLTGPGYGSQATNGIVDVNFLNSDKNQSIVCRGLTNFYRIKIDKGTDQTYVLNIDATNTAYFNLFGYANEDHGAVVQLSENNNALGLIRGTVRIGNNVEIPVLSRANSYNVSEGAQLWIDRGTVRKNTGTSIVVYGTIKVTNGSIEALVNSGITFGKSGILNVEGGSVSANQIRTARDGTNNFGAYIQTGGSVNVTGGTTDTDYYVFSLPYPSSVFNMSGGTLKVNTSGSKGGIFINSSAENYNITGGTVIAETQASQDFKITSTSPFWNLEFRNITTSTRQFTLGPAENVGPSGISLPAQPLRVLNDLRIWGKESGGDSYPGITFNPGTNDVYIGASFFIENGARYHPVSGGTPPYDAIASQPTSRNTTYFVKTAATGMKEELYQGNISDPLEFGNLVVDRSNGYEVRLTSASGRMNESVILDINGSASVLSGILNQNLYTIRTWGAISNNDRMGVWMPGVTPSRAQIQFVENPALTLSTSQDAVFGNVQVNVTPPSVLSLTSDVYIERMEYVKGLIYLKGYNLKVDNMWNLNSGIFENSSSNSLLKVLNNGFSGNSLIYTDGKASDAGLTLKVNANSLPDENESNRLNNAGPVTFPMGFTTNGGASLYFRPAQMMVKNYNSPGYVTIRPVLGALQTTNQSGGQVLQHYWRVSHSDFSGLPTVSFRFYYRYQTGISNVDLLNTNGEANYVPGKVLDESPYTRQSEVQNDIIRNFGAGNNSRAITFNGSSSNGSFSPESTGITLENANYTAGEANRFTGSVLIYYTRDYEQEAKWNQAAAWTNSSILNPAMDPHDSRQPASSTVPGAGDVAVIGWIPWTDNGKAANLRGQPHGIWVTDTRHVAEVVFTRMTDANGNPVPRNYRSNFQFRPTLTINGSGNDGVLHAKLVKGEGSFWNRESDPDYTIMDIGDFARQDSSYVIYENFTGGRVIYNTPSLFPNIYISNDNWGANNHDFTFARDITTTGNLELLGNVNLILPGTGTGGNITIGRNLVMFVSQNSGSGAEIGYGNSGQARKIIIKGDLIMANAGSVINVRNPNTSAPLVDHELHIGGSIIQGTTSYASGGLKLYTGQNYDRITLYLDGNDDMVYNRINGDIPTLYRLVINKGSDQTTTARFNTDFILNGPTSGAGISKALELQNGTFIYNNPNSSRILNLTTGNDYFNIPSTAGLEILQGIVRAENESGISLDGKITIRGGSLDMAGGNNPLEYSASGNATINITGGTLTVGGQIRRSSVSDAGVLNYFQSGGSVTAGNDAAPVNNRGVFEILNQGSSFTMTGGDLYVVRSQTNPVVSAFYFDPDEYNISPEANIHIGHSATPSSQTIGVFTGKPLPKLRINNTGNRNPAAKLEIVPAVITSLLQIDAGAIFDASGLNLTLNGDMNAAGTYIPGSNTTFFTGNGTQTINGGGTVINFHNIDKSGSGNLSLNGGNTPLYVAGSLNLHSGTVTDNGNTITVKGNVLNNAVHVNSGTGNGIVMNGDIVQVLTGNGTFGKLTISNNNGVNIPAGNHLFISHSLKMEAGVLNIGSNLLELGVNAVIEEASSFSPFNMIKTNISFTDNGLKKIFRSGSTSLFTFPLGSDNKYTPVTFNITANGNNTGSITVKPANEVHPGIPDNPGGPPGFISQDNALQYYWTLKAEGMTGFSAVTRMYYADEDVKVTDPYTIANYRTASLLDDGSGNWLKFPETDFDESDKCLIFEFISNNDSGISGDYTAGIDDAIPDMVSRYETVSSGNWTSAAVWDPVIPGGPRGAVAKVNSSHTIDVTANNIAGYRTEIFGTLKLYSTTGHRLGIITGSGTVYLEKGEIPAAVYDDFFSPAGGALEFGGISDYGFLGNISEVNHLIFSGTGERRFSNNNLTVNGNLSISGGTGLNVINYNNRRINIKGDLNRISGMFSSGTGPNATLAFSGTLPQTISGSFTASNALNNLEINNSNDINILNDVEIRGDLRFINGLVNIDPASVFRLKYNAKTSPESGLPQSFVNGTLIKEMMNGNSFTFPVGSYNTVKAHGPLMLKNVAGPSGINDWSVSYYFTSPTYAGFSTDKYQSQVSTVSNSEYWRIEAPEGGTSVISIILDGSSDVASSLPDLSTLRVVGWNPSADQWEIAGTNAIVSGTAVDGTVTTSTAVDYDSYTYFTLASVTPVATGSATITSPSVVNLCSGSSTAITVNFTGEMPYILTYTAGTVTHTTPAINSPSYNITVSPSATTIYTLTSVSANGIPGNISGASSVTVNVNPVPTVNLSSSVSGTVCENTSVTFTATAGLTNYTFRVNGNIVQNSAVNTYVTSSLSPGIQSVDVIASNIAGCSATSSAIAVMVSPLPAAAEAVTGPVSVCLGASGTYTVPVITDATSYVWSGTNGAQISSQGTNTKTITFTSSGESIITVRGRNSCGNGISSSITVFVSNLPTPGTAGSVSGPLQVCRGTSGYIYTVDPVLYATSYIWEYTGSGALISGTGNSVTIEFLPGATNGSLRVRGTNGCADGPFSPYLSITVNPSPTVAILPSDPSVCSGTDLNITAAASGGSTSYSYSWNGGGAAFLTSASTAATSFNSPAAGIFDLSCTVTDSKGCTGTAVTNITVFPAPVANAGPDIDGLCTGTAPIAMAGASASGSYSGTPVWSGSGGTWTQNPDPALATFTPSSPSGSTIATLTLTGANGCTNSTDSRRISWNGTPGQPGFFTVSSIIVCGGQTGVSYSVPHDPMATSYNWTYTIGTGVIISGTGNSITVDFSPTATSGRLSVTAENSCGTSISRSVDIVVTTLPSATFSYPGSPYCPAGTNPFPVFHNGGIPGNFTSTSGLVFVDPASGQIDLSASSPGDYIVTNTIAATGGCGAVTATGTISIISEFIWSGSADSDWNNPDNWSCGIVPSAAYSVVIGNVTNKPVLNMGAAGAINNLTIASGSALTVTDNTIRISGTITNNGIFDAGEATVEFAGNISQSINASAFAGNTVSGLTVDNFSGVTLNGELNVNGVVLVQNGSLNTNGNLTLLSTAAKTAMIDGSGSGQVIGNVTVQRYLPSGFGYKYISSPFLNSSVSQLADDMDLGSVFPLLYKYDENRMSGVTPASGWVRYNYPDSLLRPMHGYSANLGSLSLPATVDITGTVNNGYISRTLYNHNNPYTTGFNLVGNPYPSPIDWNAPSGWTKTNIDAAIYYFVASTTDPYGGTYKSYVGGVTVDPLANGIIPSMQGFFVHVSNGSFPVEGTLAMDNRVRVSDLNKPFAKSAKNGTTPLLRIAAEFSNNPLSSDPSVIYFSERAETDFNSELDALKLMNTDLSVPNLYSFATDGSKLSINALPSSLLSGYKVPLGISISRTGNIIFSVSRLDPMLGITSLILSDIAEDINQDLMPGNQYSVSLPAGEYPDRFFIYLNSFPTGMENVKTDEFSFRTYYTRGTLVSDINLTSATNAVMTVTNITGNVKFIEKIYEPGHYEHNMDLIPGIYIVTLDCENRRISRKITVWK